MTGEFDPAVFAPFREALQPGGIFLDIGANVGYYSLLALDLVGDSGFVHAFEVDPRPLRCLKKTVATEGLRNLVVHPVAVGADSGIAYLDSRAESGHSSVQYSGSGTPVRITSLDVWREQQCIAGIQAIKIDIEGGELGALRGAERLLREERPLVVCEADPGLAKRFGYQLRQLHDFLDRLDYRIEPVDGTWSPTVVARPS